ncbi:pentatricopeptide repeat-containing protein At1g77405-like [Diospyros lotus]|uniref:pentatricopeptide repeat-containing protein At1g77405-like n=1 Tax=Diospyros lotus TaxID=55363 RepID=UPI00225864A3|nr:pentatricopeptide repeat-containing protein At1g77405-like [Diospyros lotus]
MISSKPLLRSNSSLVNQVLSVIIQNRPFDAELAPAASNTQNTNQPWSIEAVSEVLRSIPRLLFHSTRSIGLQKSFRHRAPLKQRNLREESNKAQNGVLVLGPVAHRDPQKVNLGLKKALVFYYWVETYFGFTHNAITCREMACALARASRLKALWEFLEDMARRENGELVTTKTMTYLIKVLGEEGLVNEALAAFYRMKQFHCKPDVYAYNTIIYALCRVGNFKKAKFLLEQMELPSRCPPDTLTYTIMISSYCKYSMQTGCKKAIRRRLWEANHLFRDMLFKGFIPDVVTYNCLIDGCCKTNRIERALELFDNMNKNGCLPNRVTYNSFIRYYNAVNEIDKAIGMLRRMQKMDHGVPTSSSYTPVIHALCEAGRMLEARDFLVGLVDGDSVPGDYTYTLVCKVLNTAGKNDLLDDELHKRIKDGIDKRYRQVMKVKPLMSCKNAI